MMFDKWSRTTSGAFFYHFAEPGGRLRIYIEVSKIGVRQRTWSRSMTIEAADNPMECDLAPSTLGYAANPQPPNRPRRAWLLVFSLPGFAGPFLSFIYSVPALDAVRGFREGIA